MRKDELATFVDYMYWVNGRLLDAASNLTVDQLAAPSNHTTRDLRATLVHELDVEWSWRLNIQGKLDMALEDLNPDDFADLAAIRERWTRDEAEMRAWIDGLTDADVEAEVPSELSRDRRPRWQYVMHIVLHGAQQQADAATLLTRTGHSPGEIGWGEFLRERG